MTCVFGTILNFREYGHRPRPYLSANILPASTIRLQPGGLIPAEYTPFYYIGAMLVDSLIVYALYRLIDQTRLINSLMVFSIGFIVINMAAFVLCMLYVSYTEFYLMYTAMYALLLLTIIANGEWHVLGNSAMDGRYPRIFSGNNTGNNSLSASSTEAKR